jgi:hypothetical protein
MYNSIIQLASNSDLPNENPDEYKQRVPIGQHLYSFHATRQLLHLSTFVVSPHAHNRGSMCFVSVWDHALDVLRIGAWAIYGAANTVQRRRAEILRTWY